MVFTSRLDEHHSQLEARGESSTGGDDVEVIEETEQKVGLCSMTWPRIFL
jgi:hypothetical protein